MFNEYWRAKDAICETPLINECIADVTLNETITDSDMAPNFHRQMELKAELALESEAADPTMPDYLKAIQNAFWLLHPEITLLDAWINSRANKRIC